MAIFEDALKLVLQHEGTSFVDDPNDDGGASRYGISFRFYKRKVNPNATVDDIKNLTINDAAALYRTYFWEKQSFAQINSQKIANRVFDLHVNTGQGVSLLQKAVNTCVDLHLLVDDQLGAKTLAAVNNLDEMKLYSALINEATFYYKHLVYHHPSDEEFLNGWLDRLSD